ncbi:alpha/beta hydrolase [Nonomuraea rosea]|uniref:Alpha/beta hydrolase n=1 Tax=Nonomuraea rosea TaxID=638574 RepID=A0ABP7AAE8_9ACTN
MSATTRTEVIPLWPGPHDPAAYGHEALISRGQGGAGVTAIRNVTVPTLTVHAPDPPDANGTAVVVCPGGSFVTLTHGTGTAIAERLAGHGITAFVLRYRLLPSPVRDEDLRGSWGQALSMDAIKAQSHVAAEDVKLAVPAVRERAAAWGVDPRRVGVLGFSAGGLLTITAATGYDGASGRPDHVAAIYGPPWHPYEVPRDAPPLFIAFAGDDEGEGVVAGNLRLYGDWRAAGRSVELHAYAEGGHGFALEARGLPCDTWMERYLGWLAAQGF